MTKEELAALINGREYRREITDEEWQLARETGLVVVFGASDDLMEFRGGIEDEESVSEGDTVYIVDGDLWRGVDCDHRGEGCKYAKAEAEKEKAKGHAIEVYRDRKNDYAWAYKTDISHATFDIREGGMLYCRGIVFSLADLKEPA